MNSGSFLHGKKIAYYHSLLNVSQLSTLMYELNSLHFLWSILWSTFSAKINQRNSR